MTDIASIQHISQAAQHIPASFSEVGKSVPATNESIQFLLQVLKPIQQMIQVVLRIVGLCIMAMGMHRVKNHGLSLKQHSPLATVLHFIAGAVVFSYAHVAQEFSNSFFGNMSHYAVKTDVLQYVTYIQNNPHLSAMQQSKEVTFALMLVVGLFSLVRGFMLLLKADEGQGRESVMARAIVHIVAGLVGVNLPIVLKMISVMSSGYF